MRSFTLPFLSALLVLGGCRAQNTEEVSAGVNLGLPNTNVLSNTNGLLSTNAIAAEGQSSRSAVADQMQQDFSTAVDKSNANLAEGAKALARPMIDFFVGTGPDLAHLYWLIQGCPVRREVLNFAKDMWGQGALKMSQLMGRGFVGGSELAKGAMEGVGKGLTYANGYINGAANMGIDLMYKVADTAMMVEMKKLELVMNGLQMAAKALQDAGPKAKEVADNLQVALKAVEEKIKTSIKDGEAMMEKVIKDGAKVLQDGSIQFQDFAKKHWYNLMKNYVDMLKKVRLQLEAVNNRIKAIEDSTVTLSLDVESKTNSGIENLMGADVSGTV